jgi:hypothetical protein
MRAVVDGACHGLALIFAHGWGVLVAASADGELYRSRPKPGNGIAARPAMTATTPKKIDRAVPDCVVLNPG